MKEKWRMSSFHRMTFCAVLAASYAALTLAAAPISFGPIQFRISEALCVLPYFAPWTTWGLALGCSIANLFSGSIDLLMGTTATFAAGFLTSLMRKKYLAPLPPVLLNGILVGGMLTLTLGKPSWGSFAVYGAQVAAGELAVMYLLGLPLLVVIEKNGIDRTIRRLQ